MRGTEGGPRGPRCKVGAGEALYEAPLYKKIGKRYRQKEEREERRGRERESERGKERRQRCKVKEKV